MVRRVSLGRLTGAEKEPSKPKKINPNPHKNQGNEQRFIKWKKGDPTLRPETVGIVHQGLGRWELPKVYS
jgi:hypothetical protein